MAWLDAESDYRLQEEKVGESKPLRRFLVLFVPGRQLISQGLIESGGDIHIEGFRHLEGFG